MDNQTCQPRTEQSLELLAGLEQTRERRKWVRLILPDLVTRVSWAQGLRTVTHLVNLVDVSGDGVVVLMDLPPPRNRPFTLRFDDGNASTGPVPATLVSVEMTDAVRFLVKFRFDLVQPCREIVTQQKEQRAWQRVVPRVRHAILSWQVHGQTFCMPGEIQNISGGGVAVRTDIEPSAGQTVLLSVGPVGSEVGPAECRLLGTHLDKSGNVVARFAFVGLCPLQLDQTAVRGPE
jgi:hypothetical protein